MVAAELVQSLPNQCPAVKHQPEELFRSETALFQLTQNYPLRGCARPACAAKLPVNACRDDNDGRDQQFEKKADPEEVGLGAAQHDHGSQRRRMRSRA